MPTNSPKLPNIAPTKFFGEIASELKKVDWPSRQETIQLTLIVIVVSVAIGAFIGGLDVLFVKLTSMLFNK